MKFLLIVLTSLLSNLAIAGQDSSGGSSFLDLQGSKTLLLLDTLEITSQKFDQLVESLEVNETVTLLADENSYTAWIEDNSIIASINDSDDEVLVLPFEHEPNLPDLSSSDPKAKQKTELASVKISAKQLRQSSVQSVDKKTNN